MVEVARIRLDGQAGRDEGTLRGRPALHRARLTVGISCVSGAGNTGCGPKPTGMAGAWAWAIEALPTAASRNEQT